MGNTFLKARSWEWKHLMVTHRHDPIYVFDLELGHSMNKTLFQLLAQPPIFPGDDACEIDTQSETKMESGLTERPNGVNPPGIDTLLCTTRTRTNRNAMHSNIPMSTGRQQLSCQERRDVELRVSGFSSFLVFGVPKKFSVRAMAIIASAQ